jgi:hypothetical protein
MLNAATKELPMPQKKILALALATVLLAISAFAQDYKSLLGKWLMTSETDSDSVHWALILKEDGGKLTALLTSDDGEQPVRDFSYTDGVLKFKVPYEGEEYDIELKADGDRIDGTWSGGGNSGKTSGTKAAADTKAE